MSQIAHSSVYWLKQQPRKREDQQSKLNPVVRGYISTAWIWHSDCGGLNHGVAFSTVVQYSPGNKILPNTTLQSSVGTYKFR